MAVAQAPVMSDYQRLTLKRPSVTVRSPKSKKGRSLLVCNETRVRKTSLETFIKCANKYGSSPVNGSAKLY